VTDRAVCEQHGLAYDPSRTDGCVLCRRQQQAPAPAPASGGRTSLLFVAGGVLLLGLAGFIGWRWLESKRAQVGQPCEATFGCVEGADCVATSRGPVPPIGASHGVCQQACENDAECTLAGHRCRAVSGIGPHCVAVADVGQRCAVDVHCDRGSLCILSSDAAADEGICRLPCDDGPCPAGFVCTPVGSGLPFYGDFSFDRVCLPPG
jgi:hypothetical protein